MTCQLMNTTLNIFERNNLSAAKKKPGALKTLHNCYTVSLSSSDPSVIYKCIHLSFNWGDQMGVACKVVTVWCHRLRSKKRHPTRHLPVDQ